MRHLFVELPYYTAEYLNLWLKDEDNDILNRIYNDMSGTQAHKPCTLDFYKQIKEHCPKTVFHGTDVGHQYNTTGVTYIEYLKQNGLVDSREYELAQEARNIVIGH